MTIPTGSPESGAPHDPIVMGVKLAIGKAATEVIMQLESGWCAEPVANYDYNLSEPINGARTAPATMYTPAAGVRGGLARAVVVTPGVLAQEHAAEGGALETLPQYVVARYALPGVQVTRWSCGMSTNGLVAVGRIGGVTDGTFVDPWELPEAGGKAYDGPAEAREPWKCLRSLGVVGAIATDVGVSLEGLGAAYKELSYAAANAGTMPPESARVVFAETAAHTWYA